MLEQQVRRMLADPRSEALTDELRRAVAAAAQPATACGPAIRYSLTFDETLRQALRRETELFFDSILRENRSVLELLTADYTFLNERLARHYGIPDVQGSHFRRVTLPADSPRRGLLGHGSILTVTSHAIRTSPVLRGKWILNNILGTPPPEPPPNVPALADEKTPGASVQTMRERMAQHRANPVCAGCHSMIDPLGFALENFDAIGRWRDGRRVVQRRSTRRARCRTARSSTAWRSCARRWSRRPERFVTTVTEKLLTYALGRGLEYYDMPAVRADRARGGARTTTGSSRSSLGIVKS